MTGMKRRSLLVLVCLALACTHKEKPAAGPPMPAYSAKYLDGSNFDVADQKGSVVLLNVWATWCAPCRFEIPELDKLHAAYASRGFKGVGVSVDEGGANEVKPFVTEQKIGYPIVVDPEGKLATLLATTVLPTSIVIDRTGHIVWKHFGVVDTNDATLKTALESALAAD